MHGLISCDARSYDPVGIAIATATLTDLAMETAVDTAVEAIECLT